MQGCPILIESVEDHPTIIRIHEFKLPSITSPLICPSPKLDINANELYVSTCWGWVISDGDYVLITRNPVILMSQVFCVEQYFSLITTQKISLLGVLCKVSTNLCFWRNESGEFGEREFGERDSRADEHAFVWL